MSQITGRDDGPTRRYASVLAGTAVDTKVTFVEFEYLPSAAKSRKWFTLAVWPAASAVPQVWLTEKRRRALEAWEHGGKFALVDGYVGWVTEGLLTPLRVDQLVAQVVEARRAIE
ncbi:MAG: hypothetical protein FJW31_21660 [Acidobacteria bacterium]|nr:hypothetical protein [Acidobacteriota bacterium]